MQTERDWPIDKPTVLAGLVIATEAGCIMETFDQKPGEEFDMYGDSIICAVSRDLLEECREILVKI